MSEPNPPRKILFSHESPAVEYFGRNGYGKCIGVDFWTHHGRIRLNPINTKGLASGFIDIPCEEIPKVIELLQQTVDQLKK